MKTPVTQLFRSWSEWRRQQSLHGTFPLGDAAMQVGRVILPARLHSAAAARCLASEAEISPSGDALKVRLPGYDLSFFWPSEPDHNLHFVIEQEFSPANPHHYTTTPIQLTGDSTVLDVGACEGLFAFRALRERLARRLVCPETA